MIYTLTLNPSIDYIAKIEKLNKGFVNRSTEEDLVAGGKGINVSRVLNNLGRESCALGFVGGFTGNFISDSLLKDGIKTDFINISNGISRINLKLKAEEETEINASGPFVSNEEQNCLFEKLQSFKKGDILVLAGNVPKGFEKDYYSNIMKEIENKGIRVIVDAENQLLFNTLKYKPFLVKPNNFELEEITKRKMSSKKEIIEGAKELLKKGAENVLVSLGKDGGIFVSSKEVFFCPSPKGILKNSTGAGDSVLAGFLDEFLRSGNLKKAFVFGICCGSATAFSDGFAEKKSVLNLFDEMIEKVVEM